MWKPGGVLAGGRLPDCRATGTGGGRSVGGENTSVEGSTEVRGQGSVYCAQVIQTWRYTCGRYSGMDGTRWRFGGCCEREEVDGVN